MTFSLVARCESTGMFGVAVASSSPAVAARCAYAAAGVGAVSSQNVTDPRLGEQALTLMRHGATAQQTIDVLSQSGPNMAWRQVLAVDRHGGSAIHSGPKSLGIFTQASAANVASGGNLLANDTIPQVIVDAFSTSSGHLGDRLLIAMRAALDAGGEAGPIHSAGMKLVDEVSWPVADLRCDWSDECPIDNISAAWKIYKPQLQDYIQRALNPDAAPSYGVPGDE